MKRTIALGCILIITTAAAPATRPRAVAEAQVRQAATLLFSTFYRKLDAREVVLAEHVALERAAHVPLPAVLASLSNRDAADAAVAQLDATLERSTLAPETASALALKALTSATHDRYTTFFTAREYRDFDDVLDPAKLSGIGVLLDTDPQSRSLRAFFVVPDGPADRAGMRSGDLITTIDNIGTRNWTVPQARQHLLGAPRTAISITYQHAGGGSVTAVTLQRAQVQPPTVYFSMLPNRVAYLYIAAFGNATPREFRTAVARSEAAGAQAYVLDLRNDGGGIVGTALSVSSAFIPSGPIVSIQSNGGELITYEADNQAIPPKPLAVLVNAYTASASEITAAAIAESGTGIVVGTRTFGKGVVQTVTKFSDGSAIKITTGRYYTPLNHDINGRGILPSVVVAENAKAAFGTPEKDAQLRAALEILGSRLSQNAGIVHS